jgi:DNA repair protein RadC
VKIKDIPWYDRPGFRLTREGVEKLTNPELLSLILTNGEEDDILELSNKILKKYNLNKIEDVGYNELVNLIKKGKEKAEYSDFLKVMKLLSFIELSKRYNKLVKGGYNKKPINSAKDIYDMFVDEMRNYKKEVLKVVLLDTKNVPISVKEISVGTLNSSLIHPREVFKEAIKESAYSIILVHNHPSGNCEPSNEDLEVTKKMRDFGIEFGIKVLDHVIIGKKYWSWRDS